MEGILTAFIIACIGFIPQYINDFTYNVFKKEVFTKKPLSCPVCMSIWMGVVFCIIEPNFVFYVPVSPILSEGISRHLKYNL